MRATERELFGGHVPAAVAALLEEAMQSYADAERAERLPWEARRTDPQALPAYLCASFTFARATSRMPNLRRAVAEAAAGVEANA